MIKTLFRNLKNKFIKLNRRLDDFLKKHFKKIMLIMLILILLEAVAFFAIKRGLI